MKQWVVLLGFLFFSVFAKAQGNMITVNTTLPYSITICGASQQVQVEVINPSPFNLSNVIMKVTMPDGLAYVSGSITGASEFNITNPSIPEFSLNTLNTQATKNITFSISANCELINFISQGNLVEIETRVNYTTNNNINTFDKNNSFLYFIKQPNLSIINITNQTYSGNIGDVFTRCITITNGGFGELGQFAFTHTHGNGIQVNSVSIGTWSSSGNVETVYMSGANFATIGNYNTLFENAEVLTICETIEIVNCVSVNSEYEVKWGCQGQQCQNSVSTANVVFPNFTPNLVLTHTANHNFCLGSNQPNQPLLRIINSGQGDAYNVFLDIFQTTGTAYTNGLRSNIDPASFTIQVNSATPVPITPTQTFATSAQYCLTANPRGRVYLNIPVINAGDTVVVRWVYYNCCSDVCGGTRTLAGWAYQGSYKSICENSYIIPNTTGYSYRHLYGDLANDLSPSYISTGETKNFSFLFSSYANNYPNTTGRYWKFVVTLPNCLSYVGNFHVLRHNGTQVWNPTSVTVTGNTLTAIFNGNPPWDLYQSVVKFNLLANCANPSCIEGDNIVSIKSYFAPSGTCPCEVNVSCLDIKVGVVCPIICEGLNNKGFETYRSSYGKPDNNNDGLADAIPAVLDFNKIRRDRVMFGDTLTSIFKSTIKTSVQNPSWNYFYASSSITNGNRVGFLDGVLEVFQNSSGNVYSCNLNAPVIANSGSTRKFSYDLSPALMAGTGTIPTGFVLNNDDSISIRIRYKIISNPSGNVIDCYIKNEIFVSDIANPVSSANKFTCNNYEGRFSIVGYHYTTWGPNNFNVNTCNNITLSQNYYLSVGPCCQNYGGGNLFPFEYRYWAHPQTLKVVVPSGYQFISAQFNQTRTAGTVVSSTSAWVPLLPLNQYSDTLEFFVEPEFETYGGALLLSDDGFHGTLQVTLAPTCNVVQNVASPLGYYWTFGQSDYLLNSNTTNVSNTTSHDLITYQGPNIFLQSNLPSVLAFNNQVFWDISLSNITAINAMNTWFSGNQSTGVTILEVFDLDNNVTLFPVGDIYQIGVLPGDSTRHFRIRATYTSCYPSQMTVYAGWNCNAGYPQTVADYPCTPKQLILTLAPQIPNLIANITSPITTVDLCDTTSYLVEGINVQLGTAYNLKLKVILPAGVSIIPGSSFMSYPHSSPFVSISNPVNIGGTQWLFDISAVNSQIGADGLKGILDTNYNNVKITFKVITDCNYTSGSVIGFNFHGQSHCGYNTGQEISLSSELAITGATEPYLTDISINTSYVSPCADNNTSVIIKVINNGPLFVGNTDSIFIKMPEGVFYLNNSFLGIYNAPVNPLPTVVMLNNQQYLAWQLPELTQAGDSIIFEISYEADPAAVFCGILTMEATTFSTRNLMCQYLGQSCGIKVNTGSVMVPIYIYESFLTLSGASAFAVPNGTAGETIQTTFTVHNAGEAIFQNHNLYISFYHDAEGNQILSSADVLVHVDTLNVLIDTASSNTFTSLFNVPAGQSCNLIIVVDTSLNECACNPAQIHTTVPLYNAGPDTVLCSGQSSYLGFPATNGYTYQWQPATGLNNAALAQPVFTGTNSGTTNINLTYVLTTNRQSCTTKDTVLITVLPLPPANAGPNDTICFGDTVTLTASGGIAYEWSTYALTQSISVAPTVTSSYIVTVTDANGCFKPDTVIVKVNALPLASAGNPTAICMGDSTQLSASGGVQYQWSPATGLSNTAVFNPVAFPQQTTTYIVQVTDSNTCVNYDSVVITVNNNPLIDNILTNITCKDFDDGTVTAIPYNATAPYAYNWSTTPVQTTATASGLAPNVTYTVTVTDANGCTATDSYSLTEPTALTMLFSASDALCFNSCDGQALATPAGGTLPYTYIWSPTGTGGSVASLNTLCAGTYTLTVKDSNNCEIDTSFTINQPDIISYSFTRVDVLCNGGNNGQAAISTSGGILPYAYTWSPAVSTDSVADSLYAGIYVITITDNQQCDTVFTITIQEPPQLNLSNTGNDTVCIGESFTIGASATGGVQPYVFTWDNNLGTGASHSLTGDTTLTYTVFVTDSHNCVTASQSFEVYVYPVVTVLASFAGDSAICLNNSTNLTAVASGGNGGPYTYTWSQGIGVQNPPVQVTPTQTTSYYVTASDNCGSPVGTDNITVIVYPLPQVSFTAENTSGCEPLEVNFADQSYADVVGWEWLFGDPLSGTDNISPLENPTHIYQEPGTYHVTLTATTINGCVSSHTINNFVNVYPLPVPEFTFHPPFADIENPVIYFQNQSSGDSLWLWYFGDPISGAANISYEYSPYHIYTDPGTYIVMLTVASPLGCVDSISKTLIYRNENTFYMPNAFSPNADGLNDTFGPEGIGMDLDDYSLHIYDRWGGIIFKSNDVNARWDGKIKGKNTYQPVGTYVWVIFFTKTNEFDKHNYRYTGQVTLIR